MTDTAKQGLGWEKITPVFGAQLRPPKKPPRPTDGAIAMAQKSYDGFTPEGAEETFHVMTHRFESVEVAEHAADELKRAGAYTEPETSVTVLIDPEESGDKRIVRWSAGKRRGRKAS